MLNIADVEFWGSPLYHRFCAMCQYCWQQNSPRAWQYHPDTQQLVQCYAWKPNSDNNVKWSNKELTGLGIFNLRHRRTFNSIFFFFKNTCIHSLITTLEKQKFKKIMKTSKLSWDSWIWVYKLIKMSLKERKCTEIHISFNHLSLNGMICVTNNYI